MKRILLFTFLILVELFTAVRVESLGIKECDGPEECCSRNWDLAKLSKDECFDLCSAIECTMETNKDDYIDFLGDSNVREFPDGRLRVVGFTKRQRDCLRYWKKTAWFQAKCCVDGSCTKFPDNYNRNLRH